MIYDVICYNGEKELFDLRYNILKDYVNEFIVVEFDKTFSGKKKKRQFPTFLDFGEPQKPIRHFFIEEDQYNKYKDLALSSPNTQYGKGAEHWIREFCQKESIKDCLMHLKDDDIVFIGDTDEILEPFAIKIAVRNLLAIPEGTIKFKLRVYTYWLNNRSSEQFWGMIGTRYENIKNTCLNHLRSDKRNCNKETVGWHFTSLKDNLRQKLQDSYTEDTYANKWVMDNLDKNIRENKDFLGRDFKYKIDESQWPEYLKQNKNKYKNLCKPLPR